MWKIRKNSALVAYLLTSPRQVSSAFALLAQQAACYLKILIQLISLKYSIAINA
jgi:hypothetical protein